MGLVSDSYDRALAACDEVLTEEGRFPTVERVRERIGTNSPAIIKRAINDWTVNFARKHKEQILNPKIPTALLKVAEELWDRAVNEAQKAFMEKEKAMTEQEAALRSTIESLETSLTEKTTAWEKEETRLTDEMSKMTGNLSDLQAKYDDLFATSYAMEQAMAEVKQKLSNTEGALNEARAAQDKQNKEWGEKFENEHIWHLRRIEEEKESLRRQHERKVTEQNRLIESAKLESETQQAKINQFMNQIAQLFENLSNQNKEMTRLNDLLTVKERLIDVEKEKVKKLHALVKGKFNKKSRAPVSCSGPRT